MPPGEYTVTFELSGFGTIVREGVHVSVGFTATVNAELVPGGVSDAVEVRAGSAAIDPASTEISTHFNSETLTTLPGSRDFFAVAASTPGIAMSKMDVGGNGALSLQDYTAYGLRAATGMNRNEVEGIRVGGANGVNDNYISDFGSFAEIAIKAAGNTAAMPVPGTLSQSVSKSGGNTYHGSLYADFQNDAMEATNIDGEQIALGVSGGPRPRGAGREPPAAVPRLQRGRRRLSEERQGLVVRRLPIHPARAALRRGCSTRRPRSPPTSAPASSPTCCLRARS